MADKHSFLTRKIFLLFIRDHLYLTDKMASLELINQPVGEIIIQSMYCLNSCQIQSCTNCIIEGNSITDKSESTRIVCQRFGKESCRSFCLIYFECFGCLLCCDYSTISRKFIYDCCQKWRKKQVIYFNAQTDNGRNREGCNFSFQFTRSSSSESSNNYCIYKYFGKNLQLLNEKLKVFYISALKIR